MRLARSRFRNLAQAKHTGSHRSNRVADEELNSEHITKVKAMKSIKGIFSLVSAGALALAVLPVGAIPIPVPLEPGVSDRITIFRPDGTVYGTVNATEDDEALFGPNKFYTIDSVANGVNPPGPTILREANGISD